MAAIQQPGDKERKETLRSFEPDLLSSILEFAENTISGDNVTIEVKRPSGPLISFRIHPLTEKDYHYCREKATSYSRNSSFGNIKLPNDVDQAMYRSWLIYMATVTEDRQAMWDSQELWKRVGVLSPQLLIDKLFRAGEKDMIIAKIDEISGYGQNIQVEEIAKS